MAVPADAPGVICFGSDPVLLSRAVSAVVTELSSALDASGIQRGPLSVPLLADCAAVPMFAERRVIVAEGVGQATAELVAETARYLKDPVTSTVLVLVVSAASVPAALKGIDSVHLLDANAPRSASERTSSVMALLREAPVTLDGQARAAVLDALGEDVSRLDGILEVLVATFGPGACLGAADIAPYVGAAGSVPPWDLTDAISAGDPAKALRVTARLLEAGGRHPLVVLAVLRTHFERIFRVSAVGVTEEKAAAKLLGLKGSTFPAKKAIAEARRVGAEKAAAAMTLIAAADGDLKGRSGLEDRLVLEVLVGRLAQLSRR